MGHTPGFIFLLLRRGHSAMAPSLKRCGLAAAAMLLSSVDAARLGEDVDTALNVDEEQPQDMAMAAAPMNAAADAKMNQDSLAQDPEKKKKKEKKKEEDDEDSL